VSVSGNTTAATITLKHANLPTNAYAGGKLFWQDFERTSALEPFEIASNSGNTVTVAGLDPANAPRLTAAIVLQPPPIPTLDPTDWPDGGLLVRDSAGNPAVLDPSVPDIRAAVISDGVAEYDDEGTVSWGGLLATAASSPLSKSENDQLYLSTEADGLTPLPNFDPLAWEASGTVIWYAPRGQRAARASSGTTQPIFWSIGRLPSWYAPASGTANVKIRINVFGDAASAGATNILVQTQVRQHDATDQSIPTLSWPWRNANLAIPAGYAAGESLQFTIDGPADALSAGPAYETGFRIYAYLANAATTYTGSLYLTHAEVLAKVAED
jgi:hypothetical protein